MKFSRSWGSGKTSRKRTVLKTKIRWDRLGLQDPGRMAATPSMDDIRSQIISMASQGLGPDTRLRSNAKDASGQSGAGATTSTRKRRRGATQ